MNVSKRKFPIEKFSKKFVSSISLIFKHTLVNMNNEQNEHKVIQDYPIEYGDNLIIVKKPTVFAQISPEFREKISLYPNKLVIENPTYCFDTFEILVKACQLQSFTAHLDNVFELKALAQDWGVENLVTYCDNFIKKAKVSDMPHEKIVTNLINACESSDKEKIKAAVRQASTKFRDVLEDPRIIELPADKIYQLVTSIDIRPYNQEVFIKFVSKLFRVDPNSAIPLVLRCNFDLLSEEQYHIFFCCNEMHELNLNYYTALSMSDIFRSLRSALKQTDETSNSDLLENRKKYERKFNKIFDDTRKNREIDLDKIRMRLVQQNEHINDLARVLELQKSLLVESVKICHSAPTQEEYLDIATNEISEMINTTRSELLDRIDSDKAEAESELRKLIEESQHEIEDALKKTELISPETRSATTAFQDRIQKINSRCRAAVRDIYDIKCIIAAKIVDDKIHGDNYIRITDRQFDLFDDPGFWGVRKSDAVAAKTDVLDIIENAIDQCCPRVKKPHNRQ